MYNLRNQYTTYSRSKFQDAACVTRKRGGDMREEAQRRIAEARENAADQLDLGSLELTSIPESIIELKQLRTLSLNNNRLTSFPETVFELRADIS